MAPKRNNSAAYAPLDQLSAMNHAWWDVIDIVAILPCCLSCTHFPEKVGHGCLKWPGVPIPAKIVCGAQECPDYDDVEDSIPFPPLAPKAPPAIAPPPPGVRMPPPPQKLR